MNEKKSKTNEELFQDAVLKSLAKINLKLNALDSRQGDMESRLNTIDAGIDLLQDDVKYIKIKIEDLALLGNDTVTEIGKVQHSVKNTRELLKENLSALIKLL